MDFKKALAENKNQTWFVFTPPPKNLLFSNLVGLIDWYNGQTLTKAFKNKKITLSDGEKTLLGSTSLLNAERLLVFGLGDDTSTAELGKKIDQATKDLGASDISYFVSEQAPKDVIQHLQKKYPQILVG